MPLPAPPPAQFLGAARQFRSDIGIQDGPACAAITKIVRPLHSRAARHPIPRKTDLIDAARAWRTTLPVGARLALSVKTAGTTLQIDELRASSIAVRFDGWESFEPGVCLVHARLRVAPHICSLESPVVCSVSLHALARRYQRSTDISRLAIYDDLGALAAAPVDGDCNECEVRTRHGRWLCLLVSLSAERRTARVIIARTFL